MAEPLRRRVRKRVIDALSAATTVGDPVVGALLRGASEMLRWSRYERVARANLTRAFGAELSEAQRARIARGVRLHSARIVHEWLRMARASRSPTERERIQRWIEGAVELDPSCARLDELMRGGRGLLIVTAHIGNWELLAAALRRRGLDGAVVGLRKRADPSSDWLVTMRAGLGVQSLAQDDSPRAMLTLLRRGRTLGILCDLEVKRLAGEFVPFFGRPALTMTAPAALARASGLPLVPLRCVRRGTRYVLSVDEPLELRATSDRRADAVELLARMNATFERWIRETPEQWAWHQPRWSVTPDGPAALDPALARTPLHARRKLKADSP